MGDRRIKKFETLLLASAKKNPRKGKGSKRTPSWGVRRKKGGGRLVGRGQKGLPSALGKRGGGRQGKSEGDKKE